MTLSPCTSVDTISWLCVVCAHAYENTTMKNKVIEHLITNDSIWKEKRKKNKKQTNKQKTTRNDLINNIHNCVYNKT